MWLVGSFLALLTLASTLVGAEQKKELTLHQVSVQVEDAMQRFRNLSIAGDVTTAQRERVQGAYKEFKKVYDAAVEKAGGKKQAKKTPAPDDVKAAAEKVISSVSAISLSRNDAIERSLTTDRHGFTRIKRPRTRVD